jgi:hypothetical protein
MFERGNLVNPWNNGNSFNAELHSNWAQPGLFRHYAQVLCILGSFGGLGVAAYFVL